MNERTPCPTPGRPMPGRPMPGRPMPGRPIRGGQPRAGVALALSAALVFLFALSTLPVLGQGAAPATSPETGSAASSETGPQTAPQTDPETAREAAGSASLSVAPRGAFLGGARPYLDITTGGLAPGESLPARIFIDGKQAAEVTLAPGENQVEVDGTRLASGAHEVTVEAVREGGPEGDTVLRTSETFRTLPGWLSILPPLVAIGLALAFKNVIIALFSGVYIGALTLYGWNPIAAFARTADRFIVPALADEGHLKIIVFSTLLGGMVGAVSKSGGTQGIVEWLAPYATSRGRGQVATWLMGMLIFFDDYANTLLVGSTMRPVTDRLRISREKLAYIVDSTAAPVASIVPISTWIGFEIGLIGTEFERLSLPFNAYNTFIASIPYRFYPIFALVMVLTIALTRKDRGPMLAAERRAAATGAVLGEGQVPLADYEESGLAARDDVPKRALNAFIPILLVIALTVIGLYVSGVDTLAAGGQSRETLGGGLGTWLREVFSASDPYNALLWASMAGVVTAVALPVAQRILPLREAMDGMLEGFKAMLLAIVVLVLAWSIGEVCGALHTADYVVGITDSVLSPRFLPVIVFALSAAASFATGTSWGTMGILFPLVVPVAHGLGLAAGFEVTGDAYYTLMLGTISSVLAGSIWGDHCSPISDTTILSSMASGCDHVAHVRTQLPYALGVGVLGMLVGDIPTAFGLSPWISLAVGIAIIVGGVVWLGKRVDDEPAAAASD